MSAFLLFTVANLRFQDSFEYFGLSLSGVRVSWFFDNQKIRLCSLSGHPNQQWNFFTTKTLIRQISKYKERGNIGIFFVWIRKHISK